MLIWETTALVMLLLLSGFFSGVEVALISVSKIELRTWVRQRKKGAKALRELKARPKSMIITILIGNNIVNITASALATIIATRLFGNSGAGIAIGVMTFLVLLFGEITPKAFATTHYEQISLIIARPILYLRNILWPLVRLFFHISNWMLKIFGGHTHKEQGLTEQQLKMVFDMGAEENIIDEDERTILKNVLRFDDVSAREVMTPKALMLNLDGNKTVKDSISAIATSSFSRFPLYDQKYDNIIGIIHIKDVLESIDRHEEDSKLREIAVKPLFIDSRMKLNDIFKIFQESHTHLAIVATKKKRVLGLITNEDLLEEIVGEIIDESDVNPNRIMRLDKHKILADGDTSPQYLKNFFQLNIPLKFETLSEYLLNRTKKVTEREEILKIGNIVYKIEEIGEGHIERVIIEKIEQEK